MIYFLICMKIFRVLFFKAYLKPSCGFEVCLFWLGVGRGNVFCTLTIQVDLEINPEDSLEGLMLKLKLQYFTHLNLKSRLTGKDPDAGKD